MELGSILHRSAYTDCYALNADEIVVNLRTGKDVTAVSIYHDDPFAGGATGFASWDGHEEAMTLAWELKYHNIWSITLRPKFKREQYYFSVSDGSETLLMFEDGFYTREDAVKPGRLRQFFKFPWLNPSDVLAPPAWVNDTIWYQIMPDRFCRGDNGPKRFPLRKWENAKDLRFWHFYGGDLKGILSKLPYLHKLGINGIYLTPIFLSDTHHKYNTFSYETIDPDFGTEEDLVALIDACHALGIRVMLDAVFNHSGTQFGPWLDVVEKGPESEYWDWFFVNQWPLPKVCHGTDDGKYFSFAFTEVMPKLNTNNPVVANYLLGRCQYWVDKWHIDGIRFDVGNEVSHTFLKLLNRELKAMNPELYLMGEIWHDCTQWLQGDEYDSIMNYPFVMSLQNFWLDDQTSVDLMHSINRCYTLYPEQANLALFNLLDTHDTMRLLTRCGGNKDVFYQQLTMLMTMTGSACIYYGTEIAMEGGDDPDCRRPMPWHKIDAGKCDDEIAECTALIALRKTYPQLRRGSLSWVHDAAHPRMVCYLRKLDGKTIAVCLNAGKDSAVIPEGRVLYSRKLEGTSLLPGGVAIVLE